MNVIGFPFLFVCVSVITAATVESKTNREKRCVSSFDGRCAEGGLFESNAKNRLDDGYLSFSRTTGEKCIHALQPGCTFERVWGKTTHSVTTGKRCANFFDEGCVNGGIPGANTDEDWLNNGAPGKRSSRPLPTGKRCVNFFDEGCANGGLPGSNADEDWLNNGAPGKRNLFSQTTGKRCVNLFDEGCANGGLPGANADEDWLNNGAPGKRSLYSQTTGKRCVNLFDEGCANGGLPGANADEDWLNNGAPGKRSLYSQTTGKRCVNLFDEGCANGGIPGANADEDWLNNGAPGKRCIPNVFGGCDDSSQANLDFESPSRSSAEPTNDGMLKSLSNFFRQVHLVATKRCAALFDESCVNGGIVDSNKDEEWLGNGSPGKRCAASVFDNCGTAPNDDFVNSPGKK